TVLVEQMINVDMSKIILKLIVYSISLTLSYIFTKQLWKIYKNNINEKSLIYKVELEIEGNKYWYKGFVDTGNTARSIELNVPIVFAEYLDEEQKRKIEKTQKSQIEICTISSINYLEAIKVKKAKIDGKTIELGIVFVENKLDRKSQYNMVLNYHIFEEVLGGISI
ncbi:MAG: sigma-E processing peptidase SpoIIGA, partial [Clostridia bacterium]|nr:sigma-E processing peptidase SpoIIGA [Clostridia bacterium]